MSSTMQWNHALWHRSDVIRKTVVSVTIYKSYSHSLRIMTPYLITTGLFTKFRFVFSDEPLYFGLQSFDGNFLHT